MEIESHPLPPLVIQDEDGVLAVYRDERNRPHFPCLADIKIIPTSETEPLTEHILRPGPYPDRSPTLDSAMDWL